MEVGETRQDLEVLIAGGRREGLGDLRGPRERLGRRGAFQFRAEEFLNERAEVHFGACFERREEDVQAGGEAGDEWGWDGVIDWSRPANVQFVALFQDRSDLMIN